MNELQERRYKVNNNKHSPSNNNKLQKKNSITKCENHLTTRVRFQSESLTPVHRGQNNKRG